MVRLPSKLDCATQSLYIWATARLAEVTLTSLQNRTGKDLWIPADKRIQGIVRELRVDSLAYPFVAHHLIAAISRADRDKPGSPSRWPSWLLYSLRSRVILPNLTYEISPFIDVNQFLLAWCRS